MKVRYWSLRQLKKARWKRSLARAIRRGELVYGGFADVGEILDDPCYECSGYGDDYYVNDEGELECWCDRCGLNPNRWDDDD